jgi:hypothetical protein
VLRNYRKDGTPFWNELSIGPVFDGGGRLTHFIGIQVDITARIEAHEERERLLAAERTARDEAERARAHLQLVSDVSKLLADTLDVEEALTRLTRSLVPAVADWCSIHLLDGREAHGPWAGDDEMPKRRVITYHRDPAIQDLAERSQHLQASMLTSASAVAEVLRTGRPALRERVSRDTVLSVLPAGDPRSAEFADITARLGMASALFVPLTARGTVLGVLLLASASASRPYTADDLRLAEVIGRRAGIALDNARLYRVEHAMSEAVQRSLLPRIPKIDGLAFAARYLPAVGTSAVGGDWFDVLALPDGTAGVAIGDVMGHDLAAAAAMGQLRSVLRSYAWEGHRPSVVLDRLDRLVQALDMAQLATCQYAWIQLADAEPAGSRAVAGGGQASGGQAGPAFVCWANAGHLPPLLVEAAGTARLLGGTGTGAASGGRCPGTEPAYTPGSGSAYTPFPGARQDVGVLIGAGDPAAEPRREYRLWVPPGGYLLFYTDGLVESRELDLDEGLEQLRRSAERHDPAAGPEALVDLVVGEMLSNRRQDDDVAVLAIQVAPR